MTHDQEQLSNFTAASWEKKYSFERAALAASLITEAPVDRASGDVLFAFDGIDECSGLLCPLLSKLSTASDCFRNDFERFQTDYAAPALILSITLILGTMLLGFIFERLRRTPTRPAAKKVDPAEDVSQATVYFPGEIQKSQATLYPPSPKLPEGHAGYLRRSRVLSSPLQYQSFSAPGSPRLPTVKSDLPETEELLDLVD